MKRIVTIQDISCLGKCSLTVALPIISAMGVECAVIPTAVLSTHTAFEGFTFRDLTDQIAPVSRHWQDMGVGFDAIYTGYLGSFEQVRLVSGFIDDFRGEGRRPLVVVDPAMADFGRMYAGFTGAFAREMTKLCAKADIILPNLTEACFMLEIPYPGDRYTEEGIREILRRLTALGAPCAALTGISLGEGTVGVMAYRGDTDTFFHYENTHLPHTFHGTGDVFASTVVGALARGLTPETALTLAVDYTLASIKATLDDPEHRWYGVHFETVIPWLAEKTESLTKKGFL